MTYPSLFSPTQFEWPESKKPDCPAQRAFRDPVGIRTPNLRIRSAMLYPVELQSRFPLKPEAKIPTRVEPPNGSL